MTFNKWWMWFWKKSQQNWMPEKYVDVAAKAWDAGRLSVLANLPQDHLIKFLNNQQLTPTD
jgi:hypothetical protein